MNTSLSELIGANVVMWEETVSEVRRRLRKIATGIREAVEGER